MYVESVGRGRDLVLLHGWAMHSGIFAPLLPALSAHFRIHLVDLPGHGFSRDGPVGDPQHWAGELASILPRAIWFGWSLGGLLALQAAVGFAEKVSAIIELCASPRFTQAPDWPAAVHADTMAQFARGLSEDYTLTIERFLALETLGARQAQLELQQLKASVFERGQPSLAGLRAGLALLADSDLRGQVAALEIPSLWIAGRNDRLVPATAMRWASEQSTQGNFMQVASGHAPFLSHPGEISSAIIAFAERAMDT